MQTGLEKIPQLIELFSVQFCTLVQKKHVMYFFVRNKEKIGLIRDKKADENFGS